ncbi:hypothetical protein ABIE78_000698 [Sinorhizobium fredii]|jgi:hypothetical protein|nr:MULTISPECIES: hypothetical protein [Sinorhizobium]PDT84664.1 hypothetical protein CO676_06460 [Sinorhizobium sp. BJ1]
MDHPLLPHPIEDVAMLLKDIRHFNEYPGDFLVKPCSEMLHARRSRTGAAVQGNPKKRQAGCPDKQKSAIGSGDERTLSDSRRS